MELELPHYELYLVEKMNVIIIIFFSSVFFYFLLFYLWQ